jgi:peroxin-16
MRLCLLNMTRRPLVSPLVPERDFDPTSLPSPDEMQSRAQEPTTHLPSPLPTPDHLKNNTVPLLPHELLAATTRRTETAAEEYLLPKALTTASVKPSLSLIPTLSGSRDWAAEVIYALRPLVYGKALGFFVFR